MLGTTKTNQGFLCWLKGQENHQPVREDKVMTGKEAVGAILGIKYPLSLNYIPYLTQFGSRKALLCMTNKYQPVVPPHQVTSALPKAPLVSQWSLCCGCRVPTPAHAEGQR